MNIDPRKQPNESYIDAIRQRFNTEQEIDKILTRKMHSRARGEQYTPVTLEQLIDLTTRFLKQKIGSDFSLAEPRWLAGGASKLQMAFQLSWKDESGKAAQTNMVLRMSPMEAVVETSFRREAELVRGLNQQNLIPVPHCYWEDADAEVYPYPAIIYGFVSGVAKPTATPSKQVTGIGLNYGPELREKLAPQFIQQTAKIHTADINAMSLDSFELPEIGSNKSVIKQINWWRRVWEEDRGEDEPLIQMAANWLIRNAPPIDHISIVHGDLRSGNFLFDEQTSEISAWLDWELCSLGDRHEDLTWASSYQFGHFAEDGKTFLASGLLPMDELVKQYQAASGLTVDPERMRYYSIFNTWRAAIIVMATGYRVANGSKTHQDVVVTWLSGIGYLVMEQLRQTLEEVCA